jgi:hypothetical protein
MTMNKLKITILKICQILNKRISPCPYPQRMFMKNVHPIPIITAY